ncbi:C40 family peptidase [Salinisphaera sp.]|uniref:C40 family peptidase n=1 Tax=Salinisphaera sp. TaxID=1914330 RepID=UPI002D7A2E4B|nr:NlpC/P60 family protein [Salinisphaera sp.]HET7313084.1 NlpC/P60 family protein [Salinisphaera sp.]
MTRTSGRSRPAVDPAIGLALACTAALSACSTAPQTESIEKALEQTTPARQTVASVALAQVGDAYGDHMAGPRRFDDSGLAYYAYRQNGRPLPRSLGEQLHAGRPIPLAAAEPGDLVFFRVDSPDGRGRLTVGVIIDTQVAVLALPGGQAKGGGVRRVALDGGRWSQRMVGVSRLLPQAASDSNASS